MNIGFIDTVHPILQQMLEVKGHRCIGLYDIDREGLKKIMNEYDGIVIRSRIKLDADFLSSATRLKFIARSGAGMENIDLDFCKQKNIVCFNSPEGNRDSVGEHALGALLILMHRLNIADAEVRKGIWLREENRGTELTGKTVGLIGYGNMGSAFAQKLSGIGCKVIAYDKYKTGFSSSIVTEVAMDEIFEKADVISLHIPLSEETKYLINSDFISKMYKEFYLINTSRGQNVNTAELVAGIQSGKIKGSYLDVLEYEKSSFEKLDLNTIPAPFKFLIESEKVILTPHIGGWTNESYEKLSRFLGEKILAKFNA